MATTTTFERGGRIERFEREQFGDSLTVTEQGVAGTLIAIAIAAHLALGAVAVQFIYGLAQVLL
jgi:NaMN:DMB phosphoribosyltransferase